MSRSKHPRSTSPRQVATEKVRQVKHENLKLRALAHRQRRNIKDLTSIIIGAKRAAEKGDMVRCFALVSANIKYPPSAAIGCKHEFEREYVLRCIHCKEVSHGDV